MEFIALDVETANEFMGSICQIGLAHFTADNRLETSSQLVNPQTFFSGFNTGIHGLTEAHVAGAPVFRDVWPAIYQITAGRILVHHTAFDRVALRQACAAAGLPELDCHWLDSAKVARRTWPEVARSGYGLAPLAQMLGITFQHHDAREDALAAAGILLRAIEHTGISIEQWLDQQRQPITPTGPDAYRRGPGEDGPLLGHTIVFTGSLKIPRREAADHAHALGASVEDTLTKRTTLLIVGDQDLAKLAGHDKSNKHRKAEGMIAAGHPLRILAEGDFFAFQ